MNVFLCRRPALACLAPALLASSFTPTPVVPNRGPQLTADLQEFQHSPFARLPIYFEPNLGQAAEPVQFLARMDGYTLFLTPGEAVMVLSSAPPHDILSPGRHAPPKADRSVVRMKLQGADAGAPVAGLDPLSGISNYFIGNDSSRWRPNVPHYARVEYKGVYRGIDLLYYGDRRQAEYDFVVAPGADPKQIRLSYQGATLRLDESGDLVLATRLGELRQHKPRVWQQLGDRRLEIAAQYRLSGESVGLELASYDPKRPLVIDPVLTYSTYLGGTTGTGDLGAGIAVDQTGAMYITGSTSATDFPTWYPLESSLRGYQTVFVSKLTPAGDALVYSTYLGGSGGDVGKAITVDATGSAYITGGTYSSDFPVQSPFQLFIGGGLFGNLDEIACNAFVTKLGPAGNALIYSTFLGGDNFDVGQAIAVDSSGYAYVTGYTGSTTFPVLNAFQSSFGGRTLNMGVGIGLGENAFLTKFAPTGSTVVYSTYLGGNNLDVGYGIAVDAQGSVYVAGVTQSPNFPTQSPYQASLKGTSNAFVTKFAPSGKSLIYSTYLGGSESDTAFGIALDSSDAVYITGQTTSPDFPTQSPYQGTLKGVQNAFVTKLAPAGNALVYSTYLGGSGTDSSSGIAVDSAGSAYITGQTNSANFPTASPFQKSLASVNGNAFVASLAPAGNSLIYSSYLGGNGSDSGSHIVLDSAGAAYIVGTTTSTNFPTADPYQAKHQSTNSIPFISKIAPGPPTIFTGGVVDVSSYAAGGVAPGEIIAIFGSGLGPAASVTETGFDPTTGLLPTNLGGVTVTFDNQLVPLFYVSSGQIDAQVPYELAGHTATNIVVSYGGTFSAPQNVPVVAAHPGITGYNGGALVLNALTGAVVDAAHPISRGSYVTLYGTGQGVVNPAVPTGKAAAASPLSWALNGQAQIGGTSITPGFAGMTPNFAGLLQINLQIPPGAPTGASVPLSISINGVPAQAYIGGAPTPALTIAIQ
jgi:uncharacterized protein (TIGR03437 family)